MSIFTAISYAVRRACDYLRLWCVHPVVTVSRLLVVVADSVVVVVG